MIEVNLAEIQLALPVPAVSVANYVPFQILGNQLVVSGQLSRCSDGSVMIGQLGSTMAAEQGAKAAQSCALGLLSQVKLALEGDWSRLVRAIKITGFVNATGDFREHPKVMNGASDLLVRALGDAGRHARSAVGVSSLPLGAAVEVEGLFEIR